MFFCTIGHFSAFTFNESGSAAMLSSISSRLRERVLRRKVAVMHKLKLEIV